MANPRTRNPEKTHSKSPKPRPISNTFRSLQVRNYRIYFIGQLISVCGTWMQVIALGWLVLHLSDDNGFAVGTVIALQFVPSLLFGMWGGVLADRFDKRKLLIASQAILATGAAALAVVTLTDTVQLWMVYVITFYNGMGQLIDVPTRQSFVSEMVGDEHLHNAIGLNSTLFQLGRIVGPALAGIFIELVGTGTCFLLNAVSFLAVIGALLMMNPRELHRSPPVARAKGQVRQGLRYVWHTPALKSTLLLSLVVGTLAINFPVVLPLLAKVTFGGTAGTYSAMTLMMGAGAIGGALAVAARGRPTVSRVAVAALGFGLTICIASAAPTLGLFLAALTLVGLLQVTLLSTANTLVQTTAEAQMRGRVMAVWSVTILGSTPIGGPLVGWISQQFGPRWGFAVGGIATLVAGAFYAVFAWRSGRERTAEQREPRALLSGELARSV
jgi:MFS family permease